MKKVAFYGDSLTSGENNNFVSFVDKISAQNFECISNGVSGTTFGEYSIYPVDHLSCTELLHQSVEVLHTSDVVCLEYGVNDATAVCLDYVSLQRVLIDCRKCIDWIRQNTDAKIIFLALGPQSVVNKMGEWFTSR